MKKIVPTYGYVLGVWRGNNLSINTLSFIPYINEARDCAKVLLNEPDITAVSIYKTKNEYGTNCVLPVGNIIEIWREVQVKNRKKYVRRYVRKHNVTPRRTK